MILKKFYGESIKHALKEAKEQLGEQVILLESVKPSEDRKASVTVMIDEKLEATKKASSPQKEEKEEFRNVFYKRSSVKPTPALTPASDLPIDPTEDDEPEEPLEPRRKSLRKAVSLKRRKSTLEQKEEDTTSSDHDEQEETKEQELPEPKGMEPDRQPLESRQMSRRATPLIEIKTSETRETSGISRDSAVSREVAAIHRRLAQLESMLSESLISANLDYASHPSFQQLMKSGIRATTISGWFRTLMNKGIDPFEQKDTFQFELTKLVRDSISIEHIQATQPNLVFVGASGSGKTTMIMKLASSPEFFGNKKIAIVSVQPRNAYVPYSILEPFCKDKEIPYMVVKDGIDVSKLMTKLVDYDHVLFDTPSISLEKKTAFREYWKLRQILASVMPIEVHFVINATMEHFYFREAYATNHPLQPDFVAITHLDETHRWGHLIPFLKTLACGVRYLSRGAQIPDDVSAFSPTWFAEKIISTVNE